ncbi:Hsp70 family protein [Mesorhizobium sp. J428]|uniref:Hsp70 family protein n=1 Tax=Mesorhizobium sp. J428 TaxID=2898440 RepID=UPI002150986E|nr:Hsp70 family protein [Mesorhizobium sp. J428]MCR5856077.1 Hsp70 family protein [Mesorhizobium sp. J428]
MQTSFGGIDFGTSNSTVGIMRAGRPRLVPLEGDHVTLPSAVFFNFEDDRTYYGRRAIEDYTLNSEGRLLRALKSVLGSSLVNEKTRIKARSMAFTDIIGLFLKNLKRQLDAAAGGDVGRVVLGRPVHFVDGDETADRAAQSELEQAARAQGFRDIEFQFEPIAAALDYEQSVSGEELALIVDIGGGTSDFSIVRVSPQGARRPDRKADVLANSGVHVGGTDFDRLISIANVMPALGYGTPTKDGKRNLPVSYFNDLATWQRINQLYSNRAMTDLRQIRQEAAEPDLVERMIDIVRHRQGHALAGRVEQAKIELTAQPLASIPLPLVDDRVDIPLTQERMNAAIAPAIARIVEIASATVRDAGLAPAQIETLFLTGGSTAIPQMRNAVRAMFPGARVVEGDAFGSVGLGLALDAQRKFR